MSGRKKDLSVFYLTVAGSEKEETFLKRPNEIETRSGGCSFFIFFTVTQLSLFHLKLISFATFIRKI